MRSRIKLIRKELGLNQMELAEMASVSRQTMSKLENGKYSPSLKLAYKITIILALNTSMKYLSLKKKANLHKFFKLYKKIKRIF